MPVYRHPVFFGPRELESGEEMTEQSQRKERRPSIAAPAAVLCLFAMGLPAHVGRTPAGILSGECLTLADSAPRPGSIRLLEECSALYPDDVELLADLAAEYERADRERAAALYGRVLQL